MYEKIHEWVFKHWHIDFDYDLGVHYLRPCVGYLYKLDTSKLGNEDNDLQSIWVQGLGVAIYFGWW